VGDEDIRCFPLIDVTRDQVRCLLSPLLAVRGVDTIEQLQGGLTNTILRVTLEGQDDVLLLRICAGGRALWRKERSLLLQLRALLPVPEVLLADEGRCGISYPFLVLRFIEGIPLNGCRRTAPASGLLSLAEPIGRLLAAVASFASVPGVELPQTQPTSLAALLEVNEERLLRGHARARLGPTLADRLWRQLVAASDDFQALDSATCLAHGDLGGRNILCKPSSDGAWQITGLIDWEAAFSGWALWDVGSLFRYPKRYSEAFRVSFARGYRTSRPLPDNWWRTARLLDATRQLATLSEEKERPVVFAECRQLLKELVTDRS
jgi:aminoglycoside phosphotransferase (APT) family kinase protein